MSLMDYVSSLEGKNDLQRRNIILDILKSLNYKFDLQEYKTSVEEGVNIIFEAGQGQKDILITTHYDVVPNSPGANDNASSVSVVLDVYRRLQDYKPLNRIKIIIFDDEEPTYYRDGCFGSREYVKKYGVDNLIAVYNLELCGMGDIVSIWPVTKEVKNSFALLNLRKTLETLNIYFEETGYLPCFYGDHRSFREVGFKHAFCLSAIPHEDKDAVRKFAESSLTKLILQYSFGSILPSFQLKMPSLFRYYHTSEDKSKYLSESALQMMSDVVYNAVVNLDREV